MNSTRIRIGHPAYNGANAAKMCHSKNEAVEELRSRGLTRDKARETVNRVCQDVFGYTTVRATPHGDVIEVNNLNNPQYILAA